jgi:hypothetical protein
MKMLENEKGDGWKDKEKWRKLFFFYPKKLQKTRICGISLQKNFPSCLLA